MKLEPRGKYAGVKVHLDGPETQAILDIEPHDDYSDVALAFVIVLRQQIMELHQKEPDLLKDRTPEQVAAILAKEVEKASLQLNAVKSGKAWAKVNKEDLTAALLKHVK